MEAELMKQPTDKTLKHFDETYSGWGTETSDGGHAGSEGYSEARANEVAEIVRARMQATKGIHQINVKVELMGNGNYRVVNHSTFLSEY